ncbi:galactomannan galactosyltransferase 1 [Arachis duranensis]|uniref:Galactomannan galactosyltransferase 1 n=1 Tax=Arachis duranensis TaxID=130453 RepID=A0A6P4DA80_ARADU|nr:galactomannan galactosyltransferase 1 [Arachis duranensis]XP_015963797.1 galactomannan galactosyltransferase 1 [Arachis duranensis]
MVSSDPSYHTVPTMAKSSTHFHRSKTSIFLSDGCLFLGGAFSALLIVGVFFSFTTPIPSNIPNLGSVTTKFTAAPAAACETSSSGPDLRLDPPDRTFYDDPEMGYTMEKKVHNWDKKREEWLKHHPSFAAGAKERIMMVTGSQPKPCKNPIGDHLLLRFFKNKVDYCRLHGYDIYYNNALLHPKMFGYWAKYPVVKAAMLAHPEAEWIYWVDSDALFTDMDFKLPLERYKDHNLVVHGWPRLIHEKRSWTGLNAGVFLIRNCQWSLDFMDVWASMGPQTPNYEKWGKTLRSTFKDKFFPESDDQTGLAYLIAIEKDKWADKIYLESEYFFEGYWEEIVTTFENVSKKYDEVEREVRELRRKHAEKVSERYGELREKFVRGGDEVVGRLKRPFITHFTGCQPCSGDHNHMYSADACWNGMLRALNFADNQVLRPHGYMHPDLGDNGVTPIPSDYPPP